jgi:hypothetical protein
MGDVDRVESGTTWVSYDGAPYVNPLDGHFGSFVDVCLALNDAELEELCAYWEWRADLAARDIDRWWCWTVVRFGRRLLAGRRESCRHPHQWF